MARASGGAIAAIVVPWIAILFGWRYAFVFSGVLGFIWLIPWLYFYYPLDKHPRVTAEERALIYAGHDTSTASAERGVARWLNLLKHSNVWGIIIGRSLTDPIWWFYVFWIPQYLSDARGMSLKQIAAVAWLPFVAADIGNFSGGFASAFLHQTRHARGTRAQMGLRPQFVFRCSPEFRRRRSTVPTGRFSI